MRAVAVDLGGTKVLAATVHDGEVHHRVKEATPTGSADEVIDVVAAAVRRVVEEDDGHELRCVGIGVPGPVDGEGRVRDAPNLVGFDDPVDVPDRLRRILGDHVEVRVDNDVNVAALGEHRAGAGRDVDDLLAVWWGTGVGGGVILGGRIRRGPHGLGGELGHVIVRPEGRLCGCGGRGHVEAYAGRAALEDEARRIQATGRATALVDLAGDGPMKSKVWAQALDAGDEVAAELLDGAVEAIGLGIASALAVVDAELVVLGGGLGERMGEPFARRIAEVAEARVFGSIPVRVVPSELEGDAALVGAAALFDRPR